jgi:sigma-E factor negative regulatory protein RseC
MVQAEQGNGCGQCNGKGCGTGKLSQLFCSKPRQFQVHNPIKAIVGDEVIVTIAEGAVFRGISLVYAVPLLLMMAGALLGDWMAAQSGQNDVYSAIGALCGLAAGFAFARQQSLSRNGFSARPFIARKWRE